MAVLMVVPLERSYTQCCRGVVRFCVCKEAGPRVCVEGCTPAVCARPRAAAHHAPRLMPHALTAAVMTPWGENMEPEQLPLPRWKPRFSHPMAWGGVEMCVVCAGCGARVEAEVDPAGGLKGRGCRGCVVPPPHKQHTHPP